MVAAFKKIKQIFLKKSPYTAPSTIIGTPGNDVVHFFIEVAEFQRI